MRKYLLIIVVLIIAAAAYVAWPFYGLYRIADAVETRDVAALGERVDLPAVRQSIIFQALSEATQGDERLERYGAIGRQVAVNVATQAIDARLADVVTLEVIATLLAGGDLPPELAGLAPAAPAVATAGAPTLTSFAEAPVEALRGWGFRALDNFTVTLGDAPEKADWTTLTLKRHGTTWQLWAVDLPDSIIARLKPAIQEQMNAAG